MPVGAEGIAACFVLFMLFMFRRVRVSEFRNGRAAEARSFFWKEFRGEGLRSPCWAKLPTIVVTLLI